MVVGEIYGKRCFRGDESQGVDGTHRLASAELPSLCRHRSDAHLLALALRETPRRPPLTRPLLLACSPRPPRSTIPEPLGRAARIHHGRGARHGPLRSSRSAPSPWPSCTVAATSIVNTSRRTLHAHVSRGQAELERLASASARIGYDPRAAARAVRGDSVRADVALTPGPRVSLESVADDGDGCREGGDALGSAATRRSIRAVRHAGARSHGRHRRLPESPQRGRATSVVRPRAPTSVARDERQHRGVRAHRREPLPLAVASRRSPPSPSTSTARRTPTCAASSRGTLPPRRRAHRGADELLPVWRPAPAAAASRSASPPRSRAAPWNRDHDLVRIGLRARDVDMRRAPASNLVFLVDVSGSMQGPTRLPLVKQSLALLVNELREQDRVAIVVYAGSAGLVLPSTPGSDKQRILAALDRLEAGGSTAGGAGIQLAYDVARKNFIRGGNNRVILCTDGDFNVGQSSDGELVASSSSAAPKARSSPSSASAWATTRTRRWRSSPTRETATTATSTTCSRRARCSCKEMGGTLVTSRRT